MSPSTVSMDASRMDVKVDKDPRRRRSLKRPESPPPPESPPIANRSLRPPSLDLDAPACDSLQMPRSETSRRLPGVSAPTGLSGAHRPETPA